MLGYSLGVYETSHAFPSFALWLVYDALLAKANPFEIARTQSANHTTEITMEVNSTPTKVANLDRMTTSTPR